MKQFAMALCRRIGMLLRGGAQGDALRQFPDVYAGNI